MLKGKKIIIGVTGSIAAYKIPYLVRLLIKEGAQVQLILTPSAKDFVTPLTLSTLSGRPVYTTMFDEAEGQWTSHVDLGLWADLILVAPLSANSLAKMATGIADNLLLTTVLSARCPVYFAPAMDLDMYKHPTTKANIKKLTSFGYHLIEPAEGELASGLSGVGRLEEPEHIVELIVSATQKKKPLSEKKVLVNAGPTYEPIDPVRFIGNHSSGKMGVEIALAFAEAGARVDLVLGPSAMDVEHPAIKVKRVMTAQEMHDNCTRLFKKSDIAILSAAVADFRPKQTSIAKIKKETGLTSIELEPTADILAALGASKNQGQYLIGFALETDNEESNAIGKMKNKNLDMIVLNSLNDKGAGFGTDTNKVKVFTAKGGKFNFPLESKRRIALQLADLVTEQILNT